MAARTVKIRHDEETRAKIQASQLINRLQDHVFGETEISATQMKAIELLLKKTLPDLSAIDLGGQVDHDVTVRHIRETIIDPRDPGPSGSEGVCATDPAEPV
jgi:hypothetical protein